MQTESQQLVSEAYPGALLNGRGNVLASAKRCPVEDHPSNYSLMEASF
jgi:hypothetical protein